jgi:hypothetical protein
MKNIRIEEVGDINSNYPYLEVFFKQNTSPFLEIGVSDDKDLILKFYSSQTDVMLSEEDWLFIHSTAKDFLPKALKNEDDFLNFSDRS